MRALGIGAGTTDSFDSPALVGGHRSVGICHSPCHGIQGGRPRRRAGKTS